MIGHMKENVFLPDSPVTLLGRVSAEQQAALKRLGILTINDLLYHFPVRHIDAGKSSPIEFAVEGE